MTRLFLLLLTLAIDAAFALLLWRGYREGRVRTKPLWADYYERRTQPRRFWLFMAMHCCAVAVFSACALALAFGWIDYSN